MTIQLTGIGFIGYLKRKDLEMFDPFVILACAVGVLLVGFLIVALILEHLMYQLRITKRRVHQLGAETKRLRQMERRREAFRNEAPLFKAYPCEFVRQKGRVVND